LVLRYLVANFVNIVRLIEILIKVWKTGITFSEVDGVGTDGLILF